MATAHVVVGHCTGWGPLFLRHRVSWQGWPKEEAEDGPLGCHGDSSGHTVFQGSTIGARYLLGPSGGVGAWSTAAMYDE